MHVLAALALGVFLGAVALSIVLYLAACSVAPDEPRDPETLP